MNDGRSSKPGAPPARRSGAASSGAASDDEAARQELERGRAALAEGLPARALDAVDTVRRLPFGALSAGTHRQVGQLARELLRPGYDAARLLLAAGKLEEAARLEERLGKLLPGDREHEALRATQAVVRLRALLAVALQSLAAGDVTGALQRLRQALALADRAPPDLRTELDALGTEVASAAVPKLSAHARAGELVEAQGLARGLGALPPSWFAEVTVQTADAFERVARKLMESALTRMADDLGAAGALARACGELRPPVKLSLAFAEERGALREIYAEGALTAAEGRLDSAGAGLAAARASLEVLAPVDWRRVPEGMQRRCRAVLTQARGTARLEVIRGLEKGGPAVRACCALQLIEVASVQHAQAQFLEAEAARDEAEIERLQAIQLARACLDGLPDPAADDRPLRVVEREVEARARAMLDEAVKAGTDPDEAAGDAVPLASILKARLQVDAALAAEEREAAPGS